MTTTPDKHVVSGHPGKTLHPPTSPGACQLANSDTRISLFLHFTPFFAVPPFMHFTCHLPISPPRSLFLAAFRRHLELIIVQAQVPHTRRRSLSCGHPQHPRPQHLSQHRLHPLLQQGGTYRCTASSGVAEGHAGLPDDGGSLCFGLGGVGVSCGVGFAICGGCDVGGFREWVGVVRYMIWQPMSRSIH